MSNVIILVEGGLVQSVKTDSKEIFVQVLDLDNKEAETNKAELKEFDSLQKEYDKLPLHNY